MKMHLIFVIVFPVFIFYSCNSGENSNASTHLSAGDQTNSSGMVLIPGGTFSMGGDNYQAQSDEFPKHKVKVSDFYLDAHEVTNAEFEKFVEATGYKTVAERVLDWEVLKKETPVGTVKPPDSMLQPGALVFFKTDEAVPLDDVSQWWRWVVGANWKHPSGPGSGIEDKGNHPVVQVAWEDANAFCLWKKRRLPTEAEWEWASRGGKNNEIYNWGGDVLNDQDPRANYWQGFFPWINKMKDGYFGTSPVKSYPANSFGLYDMAGNVWEWCSDWYDHNYYSSVKSEIISDPPGPDKSFDPVDPYAPKKVLRGGSFLCNESYCSGYRNSRRMRNSVDTGMEHIGFRCACEK